MKALLVFWLPFVLSAVTIWMTLLAGNMHRSAWLVGLVNQALWLFWIVLSATWGLIPLNAVLWIVYYRNHLKWSELEIITKEKL
jgi:hypothetical protein